MFDPPEVYTNHAIPVAGRHIDRLCASHRHTGVAASDVALAEIAFGLPSGNQQQIALASHRASQGHDAIICTGEAMDSFLDQP